VFTFADMSQIYIEVCKWHPVPTAETAKLQSEEVRDRSSSKIRRARLNRFEACRIGILAYIGRRLYAHAGYFSVSDHYTLDRVAISVVDMVDMGQSPGKRLATGCPALVG
jgi:hypothetical protein